MSSWLSWPDTSTASCEKSAIFRRLVKVVAIMLRAPVAGAVKTRLAKSLGTEAALKSYRLLVEFLLGRLGHPWPIHIHHTPDNVDEMENWLGDAYSYFPQVGRDLGERLIHAMELEFALGVKKLIFLGGDCPYVDQARIEVAFRELENCDVVLGPATDGGYYLVGLKRNLPGLFRGIPWGSGGVLASTLAKCVELGLKRSLLAEESDVDDLAGWEAAREYLANPD